MDKKDRFIFYITITFNILKLENIVPQFFKVYFKKHLTFLKFVTIVINMKYEKHLKTIEVLKVDNHLATSIDTPLRDDAFKMSN